MIVDPPPDAKRAQILDTPQNTNDNNQLHLNPGAAQRKPRSVCKFCLWTLLVIFALAGSSILYFFLGNLWYTVRHPHHKMYRERPEAPDGGGGGYDQWALQVVQPLIKADTRFDVVALVWIRDDENGRDGVFPVDGEDRHERLILSETVFRDVHLKQKNVLANLSFQVPMSYFNQANISNYDLRASLVLTLPKTSSLLDSARSFSSWMPQGFKSPTIRKWEEEPSLQNQIFDSFGITIPLLEFHNISSTHLADHETVPEKRELEDEDEDFYEDDIPETQEDGKDKRNTFNLEFTGGKEPVTEYYPYIVTRTHLRIMDETKSLDRQLYNIAHKGLFNHSCVDPKTGTPYKDPQWFQCKRHPKDSGVWETRIQLRTPAEGGKGKPRTEWLYAPFMTAMARAAGPMDLVPIPVRKGEGLNVSDPASDEQNITVTWKLSFSGRTMIKLAFMEGVMATIPDVYNMTLPHNELDAIQHNHDMIAGLAGHRIHLDAHPRRSYLFSFISTIIGLVCYFLTVQYWYTRTSTRGIARLGTMFLATHYLVSIIETIIKDVMGPEAKGHWLSRISIFHLFDVILPLVMLKAVWRIEFSWSTTEGVGGEKKKKGWIPRVYLAKATHSERMSERTENRFSGRAKFILLLGVFAISHILPPHSTYLLTPRIEPEPLPPHPLAALHTHSQVILDHIQTFIASLYLTGEILQFIMNGHSRTYAGKYKVTTVLIFVANVIALVDLLPRVVGRSTRPGGMLVNEGVAVVVSGVDLLQAVKWRNVKAVEGEEEN